MDQEIVQGVYYLKKCIIVLRWAEYLPALMPLCERLIKEGIGCQAMLSEELLSEETAYPGQPPDIVSPKVPEEECPKDMDKGSLPGGQTEAGAENMQGILYLTDDPLVYAAVAKAALGITVGNEPDGIKPGETESERRGPDGEEEFCHPPVLIYLHRGNGEEDFGDARYALEEPEETEPEYLERVYRRCHNLPWEILVTERCWLRETVEEDVDSFWRMYRNPEITRYTERLYPTPDEERGYIRDYRRLVYAFYEFGVWTVLDRQSGVVIGRAGLSVREGCELPELGFVIGREWQGRGLAKEVCRGILRYAQNPLGFERVQVLVHEKNAVSLHLCRELGFREQAVSVEAAGGPGVVKADQSKAAASSCLVEMEQNGQRASFVYMVYDCNGQAD